MDYRIVCVEKEAAQYSPEHAHVIAVGIGSNLWEEKERLTLSQVIQKMDTGDRFYTQGFRTGKINWVEKYWCSHCNCYNIRSSPDVARDNDIDYQRYCSWDR